jgi:hypothetical protein
MKYIRLLALISKWLDSNECAPIDTAKLSQIRKIFLYESRYSPEPDLPELKAYAKFVRNFTKI